MAPLGKPGEFELIEHLAQYQRLGPAAAPAAAKVALGIGDDAAVLHGDEGELWLLTTDMLVDGIHFLLEKMSAYDLGAKAMAVNVSDIAAMGGNPICALISIGLPRDTPGSWTDALYQGLADEAGRWGASIVGGDTVISPVTTLNVALVGRVEIDRLVLRSGAQPGDRICVTHTLGDSAAGLEVLRSADGEASTVRAKIPEAVRHYLLQRHLRPEPRVLAGRELSEGIATAMMDLSDGLAGDLRHICRASKVGAVLNAAAIPLSHELRVAAPLLGKDPLALALSGGEDYELLFTTSLTEVPTRLPDSQAPITVIGEITEDPGIYIRQADGNLVPLTAKGYTHF